MERLVRRHAELAHIRWPNPDSLQDFWASDSKQRYPDLTAQNTSSYYDTTLHEYF